MKQSKPGAQAVLVGAFFALSLALTGVAAEAGSLDRYLEKQMRKARVPGLATAIVVDDEVVQAAGYGWADPETETPVTPDTLFFLASVSKPVTATVAMRLVERRLLDLDADVNGYLSFDLRNPRHPAEPVTLRQLMSHSSSINDQGFYQRLDELVTAGDWPGTLTGFLVDYLTPGGRYYSLETSFHEFAPGTGARYSNVGVTVVGALVEAVTGRSFESVSRELVFEPLEMSESSWLLAHLDVDHVAVPCGWSEEGFFTHPHFGLATYPAGNLRTSALQLANFARLHLNGGRFAGRRVLKRRTAAEMVSLQWSAPDRDLGLGFDLLLDDGNRVAHHGGGNEGSATWLWLGLDEGIGVVMLTNGAPVFAGPSAVRAFFKIRTRLIKQGRRIAARGPR